MPVLKNQRQELFAQGLAAGKSASLAYEEAGYVPNRGNASILKAKQNIIDRVLELQRQQQERIVLSRQSIVDALLENIEKALGRRPLKVGPDGEQVFIYRGDVANTAIRLAGLECGLFTERKEINYAREFAKYSDAELVQILEQEAQALLEHHSRGDDGDGDPDA
jgi:hypothetical protein